MGRIINNDNHLVGGYFATKAFSKVVRKGLDKANIDFSLSKFLVNAIKIACYVVIIMSALSYIGISTTGLVAFFSASAAAIALALRIVYPTLLVVLFFFLQSRS